MTPSFRTALKDARLVEADRYPNLIVLTADLRKSLRLDEDSIVRAAVKAVGRKACARRQELKGRAYHDRGKADNRP